MTQWFLFHKHCLTIRVVYDVIAKMYGKFQVGLEQVSHCQITALSIFAAAAAAAKSLQSCPTLCDPIDGSSPGSPIPGILQARTLEWVAISFSNIWKWKVKVKSLSHIQLLATTWTEAYQAPLFMEFSRQESWSGVPLPSPVQLIYMHKKSIPVYIRTFATNAISEF